MNRREFLQVGAVASAVACLPVVHAIANEKSVLKVRRYRSVEKERNASSLLVLVYGDQTAMQAFEDVVKLRFSHFSVMRGKVGNDYELCVVPDRESDCLNNGTEAYLEHWIEVSNAISVSGCVSEIQGEWQEYRPGERLETFLRHETFDEMMLKTRGENNEITLSLVVDKGCYYFNIAGASVWQFTFIDVWINSRKRNEPENYDPLGTYKIYCSRILSGERILLLFRNSLGLERIHQSTAIKDAVNYLRTVSLVKVGFATEECQHLFENLKTL